MIAVFLLDFGGPETLADVRPFLKNLFSDKSIFPIPGGKIGQNIFSSLVSRFRSKRLTEHYRKIGGGSPLPKQSRALAASLEEGFQKANLDIRVFVGMRYTNPGIEEVLREISLLKPEGMVVIPMFPQYSTATTLSVFEAFNRAYEKLKCAIPFKKIDSWHDQPDFIAGWCYSIKKGLDAFDPSIRSQVTILFTAHGLPVSFVTERKDPYPEQIKECAKKIMTYLGGENPAYLSYQSKVGPVEWLKPATIDFVKELASGSVRHLLIVPISFLTDHFETLYEINHLIIPEALKAGMKQVVLCEALCHGPYLRKTLEGLVLKRWNYFGHSLG